MTTDWPEAQVALPNDYRAALEGAVFLDASAYGRVALRGPDRAHLLQRLSTNDMIGLQLGQGARTVLTNHNGRIIDLLMVAVLDAELLLRCSAGQGGAVTKLLRKNIFFNDKATVENRTAATGEVRLYGPQAAELLRKLTGQDLAGLARFGVASVTIAGLAAQVIAELPIGGYGFALVSEANIAAEFPRMLAEAGATALSAEVSEALRVEQGYSRFGHELSLEYIPLETGLADAISFNKGCYVGQEIIARMDSRRRLAKRLMGLRLSAPVAAPASLMVADKEAGDLTSIAVSPRHGPIGLAYVRSAFAVPGHQVGVAGTAVTGEVVELPFAKSQ